MSSQQQPGRVKLENKQSYGSQEPELNLSYVQDS